MNQKPSVKVAVFGASNVDIMGFPHQPLLYGDANVGTSVTMPGGVGRNIAENLTRLGLQVELFSFFGTDPLSDYLKTSCAALGISIGHCTTIPHATTATFLAVMDHQNDLALGISAMDLYENLKPEDLNPFWNHFPDFDYIVLETNFHSELLQEIVRHKGKAKLVLDTVSGKKAKRAEAVLSDLYLLKTNLLEAKMLLHKSPDDNLQPASLVQQLLDKGVEQVCITLGKEGVVFGNSLHIAQLAPIPSKIVNTVGAGDSFVAGLIYADALGLNLADLARHGMAAAAITVQHHGAVSPHMHVENLNKTLETT